jgi:hypothetical protein
MFLSVKHAPGCTRARHAVPSVGARAAIFEHVFIGTAGAAGATSGAADADGAALATAGSALGGGATSGGGGAAGADGPADEHPIERHSATTPTAHEARSDRSIMNDR